MKQNPLQCRGLTIPRQTALRKLNVTIYVPESVYQAGVWFLLLYRKMRYGYSFRRIPLTRGMYAKVDPEDYPRLSRYKWYATSDKNRGGKVYAERTVWEGGKKQRNILMHREILFGAEVKTRLLADHINGDGRDNRKANLRAATHRQNVWNTKARGKSKYKGVWQVKGSGKWCARIKVNGRQRNLGRFDDEVEAAKAYDRAAKEECGEFARLNFPPKWLRGRREIED